MIKQFVKYFTAVLIFSTVTCSFPYSSYADSEDVADEIKYTMDSDQSLRLVEDDFNEACDDVTGEELNYIKFTLPDEDEGVLYYDYDEDEEDNEKISSSNKYYFSKSPYISNVTFVPDEGFEDTMTIKYKGYDVDGNSYAGEIEIKVEERDSKVITSNEIISYKTKGSNEVIDFDKEDFNDVCNEKNDEDLDYVKFTIPSASKGILYYNYDDGQYSSIVSSGKKYYYSNSPFLTNIAFVPNKDFEGVFRIEYKGYDIKGDSFTGSISITVGNSSQIANVITYSAQINTTIPFMDEDFNNVCKSLTGSQLNYVNFRLPSSSLGTLYYGYNSSDKSKVRESTEYYYGGTPYLLNVTFVPADNVTGAVTVSYTGYENDGQSYIGTVQIIISAAGAMPTIPDTMPLVKSKYFRDVDESYSWAVPYIDGLYESGIISGSTSGDGTKLYNPASFVTRGDYIYILYKALNPKTSSITTNFTDVPTNSYYYNAIITSKALGIIQGSDNKFFPNSPITREDAMVMALRAVNITGKTIPSGDTSGLSKYLDGGSLSEYSRSAVAALMKAGVINGSDDNKIYPQGYLTRAQVSAIIFRIKNLQN